jgi:hypothetical protein
MFRLATIISDMKLHLYRVRQGPDRIPWPRDLTEWQRTIRNELNDWKAAIPQVSGGEAYMLNHLEIRYHRAVMLLLRPSLNIQQPPSDLVMDCSNSAVQTIRIYEGLQRYNKMQYTVLAVHNLFLSGLTMLYCAQVLKRMGVTKGYPQSLPDDIRKCSSVLSTMAEVGWAHARRALVFFNSVANVTLDMSEDMGTGPMALSSTGIGNSNYVSDQTTMLHSDVDAVYTNSPEFPLRSMANNHESLFDDDSPNITIGSNTTYGVWPFPASDGNIHSLNDGGFMMDWNSWEEMMMINLAVDPPT